MAMIQDTNKVHFTGMTRIELEGNKIIASQNGESKVTISANSHSLVGLADKISESNAKKNIVTDQDMLDLATVEKYRGYSTRTKRKDCKYWYGANRISMIDFIEFYLSANRLRYSLEQMREILISMPSRLDPDLEYENSDFAYIMSVSYIEAKIQKAADFAKSNGFELPSLKNTSRKEEVIAENKLKSLNWAV